MKVVSCSALAACLLGTVYAPAFAADLPFRKAAPVEYVRVCDAYGAGFFYIPGTDTCLRVGGQIRAEATFRFQADTRITPSFNAAGSRFARDFTSIRGRAFISTDSRTQTAYGTLRTFFSLRLTDDSTPSGAVGGRGGLALANGARPSTGLFQGYNGNPAVWIDKAFIQFAGFTAGKAQSFFDFDAQSYEYLSYSVANSNQPLNLFAYTATFGGGFSATISAEDASYRRVGDNGQFVTAGANTANFGAVNNPIRNANGTQTAGILAYAGQEIPDLVANVRYDAPWGSAQISGAYHQIQSVPTVLLNNNAAAGALGSVVPGAVVGSPSADGFAVQGGVKILLPMLAAGDSVTFQGVYEEGAMDYINEVNNPVNGISSIYTGFAGAPFTQTGTGVFGTSYGAPVNDAFVVQRGNGLAAVKNRGVGAFGAFRHYFLPTVYASVFGSWANIVNPPAAQRISASNDSAVLWQIGANLTWTPVKDLQIGGEYVHAAASLRGLGATSATAAAGTANVTPASLADDRFRFTVRRAF